MTALRDQVVSDTLTKVSVVYLDRATVKWWNSRRGDDDTATFCGWYWVLGEQEAGPFKTRSSCLRDAYYLHVLQREVPSVGHSMMPGFKRGGSRPSRQNKREATRLRA